MTFFVLNTGGKALEWFHANLCQDMTEDAFYSQYLPEVQFIILRFKPRVKLLIFLKQVRRRLVLSSG